MNWQQAKEQILQNAETKKAYNKMDLWFEISRRWTNLKIWLTKERHIYKPYLDLYLSLGFISLRTSLMQRAVDRYAYDYIKLDWKLFKWSGGFNLYKPGEDL